MLKYKIINICDNGQKKRSEECPYTYLIGT